jgi:hypothetical protein
MANGSGTSLSQFITKFTDVATLSKLVTDVGPGFLIALSLALLFNLLTDIPILPFQRYAQIERAIRKVKDSMECVPDSIREERKKRIDWEAEGANLTATTPTLPATPKPEEKEALGKHEAKKKRLVKQVENSIAEEADLRKQLTDNTARLVTLRGELEKAGSLRENLELLEQHLVSLLFLSLTIGVIFSQASGHTFYNGSYRDRFWGKKPPDGPPPGPADVPGKIKQFLTGKASESIGNNEKDWRPTDVSYFRGRSVYTEARQKEYEEIVKNYYRYLEVAMNMIVPATMLSLALTMIFIQGILTNGWQFGYLVALAFVLIFGFVSVRQLYEGGYDYYLHYKVKTAHFIAGLWDEMNPPAAK